LTHNATLHDNTVLQDNTVLHSNTVLHDNTVLQDNTVLHSNTALHDNTVLHVKHCKANTLNSFLNCPIKLPNLYHQKISRQHTAHIDIVDQPLTGAYNCLFA